MFMPPRGPSDQPARPQYSLFTLAAVTAAAGVLSAVLRLNWPVGGKVVLCLYSLMGLATIILLTRLVLEWNKPEA